MGFEWDSKKNRANIRKHGIDFQDVLVIFESAYIERVDDRFDYGEERMIVYGQMGPDVAAVVYVWRSDRRRIISARRATKAEARAYSEVIYGDRE